jgi:energy-coupling factor transport system substrate-specific component
MSRKSQGEVEPPDRSPGDQYLELAVIPVGIVVNLVAGSLVSALKLPIYLDALGTIVIAILVGWKAAALVGVASFCLASIFVSPAYLYFVCTQVAIAVVVRLTGEWTSALRTIRGSILAGIGLGLVAGICSAPIIAFFFDGSTGTGRDLVTALMARTGRNTFESVLISGLLVEPVDKTIQLLVSIALLRALPRRVVDRFVHRVGFETSK